MSEVFGLLEGKLQTLVRSRFPEPTPIQKKVIPRVLEGGNCLIISETGSGKTEAALLPLFHFLLKERPPPISLLYITPLKSLNRDLLKRMLWWANGLEFDVGVRHGDTSQYERTMQAENPPDVLVSTPETLQAMLSGKRMANHLKNVRWIVVDEVHELIDNKRGAQLSIALERLKDIASVKQIVGLSATVGTPETVAKFLTGGRECAIVHGERTKKVSIQVELPLVSGKHTTETAQTFLPPETNAKLQRIAEEMGKTSLLVFTNTREMAEVLSSRLKAMNLPIDTHHSSLSRDVRIAAEEGFKKEEIKALVCTSSLELGIDIGSIGLVLQYQSPRQVTKLMQRVGRAGHSLSRISEGIILAGDVNDCFESAVIAKLGMSGWIEPTSIYENALDVVANQLVGMVMEHYQIEADKAYQLVTQAYPFRKLSKETFLSVARTVEKLGNIWIDQEEGKLVLKRKKRAFDYFFQNLSTIPDSKTYKVIDIISGKPVGSLDAEFIALHATPGAAFIVKGQPWKILEIQVNAIVVEPARGLDSAIPAWEGELIPVPEEVAQGVAQLRKEAEVLSAESLQKKYPIDSAVAEKIQEMVKKQKDASSVPGPADMPLEYERINDGHGFSGTYVIIHSCFGSLINETLGNVLATILMGKLGSIGLQTDPYRIILKIQRKEGEQDVLQLLKQLDRETIQEAVREFVPKTDLFAWRFMHVAQRFGMIAKDADVGKNYIRKIISVYKGTPPWQEAMNEVLQDKLDVSGAIRVAERIGKGELKLSLQHGLSPLGQAGLGPRYEIVAPEKPDLEVFGAFKERMLESRTALLCTSCAYLLGAFKVRRLPSLRCPKCESKRVGVVPERYMVEAQSLFRKALKQQPLVGEEPRWVEQTNRTADLTMEYGEDAVIALAGNGIGPATAARVLAKNRSSMKGGDALFFDILQAEKQYVKTRRFWQ